MARILLIEDHEGVAAAISETLVEAGYEVVHQKSVEGALALLQRDSFDLEIWDGTLRQDLDGVETAVARFYQNYNVMVHTGDERAYKLAKRRAVPHACKPADPVLLLAVIEQLLERARHAHAS